MATLYDRIVSLCEKKNVSFTRMLVDIGVSRSMKQKLHDNPDKTITLKTAQKMADYFGVSVDDILGKKEKPSAKGGELVEGLPKEVQRLIAVCLAKPGLATSLLSVLQQLENDPSAQG